MPIPSEHIEQVAFVRWFRAEYPNVMIFAIPNGELRAISVAQRLKAEGVVSGIPDLFIPEWNIWIEMKRQKGGKVSKEQRKIHEQLRTIGHTVIIGYGHKDAIEKLQSII